MQLERNVFPKPVFPVNNRFFSLGLSKLFINLSQIFFISSIFSFGDIDELYFEEFTSGDYILESKSSKLSFDISKLLILLYSISNIRCFKQLHILVV